jgi:hypothetical protein
LRFHVHNQVVNMREIPGDEMAHIPGIAEWGKREAKLVVADSCKVVFPPPGMGEDVRGVNRYLLRAERLHGAVVAGGPELQRLHDVVPDILPIEFRLERYAPVQRSIFHPYIDFLTRLLDASPGHEVLELNLPVVDICQHQNALLSE